MLNGVVERLAVLAEKVREEQVDERQAQLFASVLQDARCILLGRAVFGSVARLDGVGVHHRLRPARSVPEGLGDLPGHQAIPSGDLLSGATVDSRHVDEPVSTVNGSGRISQIETITEVNGTDVLTRPGEVADP